MATDGVFDNVFDQDI